MEPTGKKYGVFISYSHEDADYITPITELLSIQRTDLVFQDKKDIRPGTKWREEIDKALHEAEAVIIFWCRHAKESTEIKNEYTFAIANKKSIIPVLLDQTSLDPALAPYQWIDFRSFRVHERTPSYSISTNEPPARREKPDIMKAVELYKAQLAQEISARLHEHFPSL